MLYPSMNQLLENIDNRYLLVNITAKRAREIAEEARADALVLREKPVKLAINEIADGTLSGSLRAGIFSAADQ